MVRIWGIIPIAGCKFQHGSEDWKMSGHNVSMMIYLIRSFNVCKETTGGIT